MAHNTPEDPCEWCGSINDECPCGPDEWDEEEAYEEGES